MLRSLCRHVERQTVIPDHGNHSEASPMSCHRNSVRNFEMLTELGRVVPFYPGLPERHFAPTTCLMLICTLPGLRLQ